MHTHSHILPMLALTSTLPWLLLSCGGDRVNIEFRTSPQIYVDDSKTDTDKLNKELEYDLREAEKKRRQKQREAEAAAKTKAEQKAKVEQKAQEETVEDETTKSGEIQQRVPQQPALH